jgi:transposase
MRYYAGLDVSLKRTAICVVDEDGGVVWRGGSDTHPEMIAQALKRWRGMLDRVGLETGSTTPWLARGLKALGLPVVVMDARRAADALKARVMKTDVADARSLAEMLRTGWYTEVFVKSEDSHRIKALLSARDQLVRNKRTFFGQIRGLLRPFGIRLAARQGTKRFDEAARAAVRQDDLLYACVNALLEALAAIEMQIAALDRQVRSMTQRSEICWRLMSVPGVGPITALAFVAAIEEPGRFRRTRDVGAYLGLTPKRYQSGEKDVSGSISRQGDGAARHYLYEAANCLLTTWSGTSPLKSWGLGLVKRIGAKKARVAVARKLACLLLRLWKDESHFNEGKGGSLLPA